MFQNVKYRIKMNVFLVNVLQEMKKCIPLHPLSVFGSYFLKVFIDRFT